MEAILATAENGQAVEVADKARSRYYNALGYVKRHNLPLKVRTKDTFRFIWCEKKEDK
jgi:hypothetical protein